MADIASSVLAKLKSKTKSSSISYVSFREVISEIQLFLELVWTSILKENEFFMRWQCAERLTIKSQALK